MKLIIVDIFITISFRVLEEMLLFIHLSTKLRNCTKLNCNMAQLFAEIFIVAQIFSSLLVNFFAINRIIRKYYLLLEYLG